MAKQIPIGTLANIPLMALVDDPHQPRTHFDQVALQQLTESIALEGIKVPLQVIPAGKGQYVVKCGARRKRAAETAGLEAVPCLVVAASDPLSTMLDQVLENSLRAELSPHDDAAALLLVWLGRQIQTFGGDPNPSDGSVSERIEELTLRLCGLAEVADLDTYTGSGKIRVPWREVLVSVGRGDWSEDRRKKHLRAIKHLDGTVLDAIAGEQVSAATVQALAALPSEEQAEVLAQAQAKDGPLGEELRKAVGDKKPKKSLPEQDDQGLNDGDLDLIEKPAKKNFEPDPSLAFLTSSGGTASKLVTDRAAPERGSTPPAGHEYWVNDEVLMLQSAMEAVLTTLEDTRGRVFNPEQQQRIQSQWAMIQERMQRLVEAS